MKIVDDEGRRQPWDGIAFGRLAVRGATVASAYFGDDTPILDAEGFFDTGDVATIDPHGYMQIVDRTKDVIKSGGEWISSIAIENLALAHPGVAEAAVIGIPHAKWGERPLLVLVGRDGAAPDRGGDAGVPRRKNRALVDARRRADHRSHAAYGDRQDEQADAALALRGVPLRR